MTDDTDDDAEPRVRDLLRRREEAEAALAPTTQSQLRAWFGLPSFDDLAEAGIVAPEVEDELSKRKKKRAETLANVDPAMIALMDRHTDVADRFRIRISLAEKAEARLARFDDTAIQVPTEDDFREVDIPHALREDLSNCTPQAFLRDLARPETDFSVRFQPAWDDLSEEPAGDPWEPIRSSIYQDYRAGTTIEPAVRAMRAAIADLRALLARPWAEAKRERARKREAELLGKLAETPPVSNGGAS
jgi:hypothetical protein